MARRERAEPASDLVRAWDEVPLRRRFDRAAESDAPTEPTEPTRWVRAVGPSRQAVDRAVFRLFRRAGLLAAARSGRSKSRS